MDSKGTLQRDAVTVIFRLLEALSDGELSLAQDLLEKATALDVAEVNSDLLKVIAECIGSNCSLVARRRIVEMVSGTPYESAAARLVESQVQEDD